MRPIAIGMTLRRLAGKIAMAKLKPLSRAMLHPHQLGVGMQRGAEIGVHVLRRFFYQQQDDQEVICKIDYRNAFNSLRRDVILRVVKEHAPQLYPFVWQSYSHLTNL